MAEVKAWVRGVLVKVAVFATPILPPRLRERVRARAAAYEEGLSLRRKAEFWAEAPTFTRVLAVDDKRGHRLLIDPSDQALARDIFFTGGFEVEGIDHTYAILVERSYTPAQIVDVGANVGTSTIDLMDRFPAARGFAFEPEERNSQLLKQNLLGNGLLERVSTYEAAVSDQDGEAMIEISADNPGDHRLRKTEAPGAIQEESRETRVVATIRLDTLAGRGEIDPALPGLLWIDAQGHEAQVLAGAELLRRWPTVVEFWPYGLRRSGGYDLLLELMGSYESVREIRRVSNDGRAVGRELTPSEVDRLAQELTRDTALGYTDLILWPREPA